MKEMAQPEKYLCHKILGRKNRLEKDFGLANDFTNIIVASSYQWGWNLENSFNYYVVFDAIIVFANKNLII
ncbi:MAG: hypothetical protein P8P88_09650 [Polaribacter sp.]|nr:hypothetical protein [Polaribacter sp.]